MGGRRLYKLPMPYNGRELREIDFAQSFDTMYLAHLNYEPGKLTRADHDDWGFVSVAFGPTLAAPSGVAVSATVANTDAGNSGDAYFPRAARYVVSAVNEDSGQESLPSLEVTATNDLSLKRNSNRVTWSAVTGATYYRVFKANLDGAFGFIGEVLSGTDFVDDNIEPDLSDGPRQGRSPFAAAGDYPSSVFFFEQRTGWGRTINNPNALYLSRSADLENMDISRPLVADDAITLRLVAERVNAVNQVVPMDDLIVLTSDGPFRIVGSNEDYLSANPPPRQRRQGARGASRVKAAVADETVFYLPNLGDEVLSIGYTFEIDGYRSNNVAIFSPHFFEGFDIIAWAYAREPLSCIWAVRSDGKLLCFTWQREQEVWGWTLCETAGRYLDVCVIPERPAGALKPEDRVYFIVEREIAGVTRRFVERMASAKWQDQNDACFLDCAFSFSFEDPTAEVSVPKLAGARVDVLADGNVYQDLEVAEDGTLTIDFPARIWHVGLPFVSTIETLPLSLPSRNGGSRAGKVQDVGEIVLRVYETRGVRAGRKENDLLPLRTRRGEPLGSAKSLLTGDYSFETPPCASLEANVWVKQVYPLPMTISSIFLDPIEHGG